MKLSIVIPIYNEGKTITSILSKVESALLKLPPEITSHEIILIDDGSKDNTKEIITENYQNNPIYTTHFQETNQGKGAAITKGFSISTGDIVLIQDADMEYDPFDYPVLLKPIVLGQADVVYGSRFKGEVSRVLYYWHYLGNQFLTHLSNMMTNLNLTDMETCYKVFRGELIRNMTLTSNRFGIEPEITAKISKVHGIRIYEVPISYYGRTYEDGKKIGWKDGFSAIWCIIKFNLFTNIQSSYRCDTNSLLKKN